jgi:hypothetical protein
MARRLVIAVEQPIWACRWSRRRHQSNADNEHPATLAGAWVCVRAPDGQRAVSEAECAECAYWEPESGARLW